MSRLKTAGKAAGVCSVGAIIVLTLAQFGSEFRTSPQGLEIIGNAEGCRREPYHCSADVLTVGIGSTSASGEMVEPNRRYSDEEIAERWAKDIKIAERCVNQYANGYYLPQGVFDAATSLTFNVGCGAVRKSTMFRKLNRGDYVGACDELRKWVYAGGRKLRGLEIRRERERELCLSGLTKP